MKRHAPIPRVRPTASTKPPYCGKPGAMVCGACAAAYKEWVQKNTEMRGGMEDVQ